MITDTTSILKELKSLSSPKKLIGMTRSGINSKKAYGINIPSVRKIAREIKKENLSLIKIHQLALELWKTEVHEARILAGFIDQPELVNNQQLEDWVIDFNSWDICDSTCGNLFDKTEFAIKKIYEWEKRKEEFVKRAAFSLIAYIAVHNKKLSDKDFLSFFPLIIGSCTDNRIYVKKAVNWALREIGKRNLNLNRKAVKMANEILKINSPSARWIASDALRELTDKKILERIKKLF